MNETAVKVIKTGGVYDEKNKDILHARTNN
jgi:hypothetical protein